MKNDELRQLDEWIFENIPNMPSNLPATRDPVASMMLLKRCAEKIADSQTIGIEREGSGFVVSLITPADYEGHNFEPVIEAPTLELALARFAKTLFTKEVIGEGKV